MKKPSKLFYIKILILFISINIFNRVIYSNDIDTVSVFGNTAYFGPHLNFDEYNDVIIFETNDALKYRLPTKIGWGMYDSTSSGENVSSCFTKLIYPNWDSLFCSYMITYMNQDTLSDIVLFVSGIDTTNQERKDTSRIICIFGQNFITQMDTIMINDIDTVNYIDFYARDLRIGYGFSNSEYVGHNGIYTYEVNQIDLNIANSYSPPITTVDSYNRYEEININTFPNPVTSKIMIEIFNIPVGYYELSLQSIYSNPILNKEIEVNNYHKEVYTINTSEIHSGFYFLILKLKNQNIKSIPIIIIH
ncbi:MAG: hypothetical protein BAJALOKI1v1_1640002 [Promethearchaeota archaeon]|nr:MAG: hypothetical protein BAJALOKI1v1_1640002 [Candidatus Lokiarchaeota archaeon]